MSPRTPHVAHGPRSCTARTRLHTCAHTAQITTARLLLYAVCPTLGLLPCATCTMISSPPPSSLSSLEANTCSFSFSSIKTTLIQHTTSGYELEIQLKVGVTLGSVSNAWMWCFIFYSFIKFQLLSHMNGLYCEVLATDKSPFPHAPLEGGPRECLWFMVKGRYSVFSEPEILIFQLYSETAVSFRCIIDWSSWKQRRKKKLKHVCKAVKLLCLPKSSLCELHQMFLTLNKTLLLDSCLTVLPGQLLVAVKDTNCQIEWLIEIRYFSFAFSVGLGFCLF